MARGRRRNPSLRRRASYLQPRRRFTVFCEGENTEPAYFDALREHHKDAMIAIKTIGKGVSPLGVAKAAVTFGAAHPPRDSWDDEVWAVFDRDTHGDFDAAVQLCAENGIGVGRSNPCFELWLLLHVADYDKANRAAKVQKALEAERKEYRSAKRKLPDCAALVVHVETAEGRAEVQLKRRADDRDPFGNPSTTVFRLTRAIGTAAAASARKR